MQGNLDGAVRELTEAFLIDPDGARLAFENALVLQAETYKMENQSDEAVVAYNVVLEISPNNQVAQERKRRAELAAKQRDTAVYSAQAVEYEQAERWDDAVIAYQHLVSLSDDQRWQEGLERCQARTRTGPKGTLKGLVFVEPAPLGCDTASLR